MKKKCLLFGRVLLAFLVFEVVSFVLPELWALFLSGKEMEKELMLQLYQAGSSIIVILAAFPVVEELMFRGVTLHILKEGGDVFAIIVSTLFFALGHSNPVNVLLGLCTGILFAHMTLKYKGIRAAYACHVFVNLLGNLILPLLLTLQNTP